VVLKVLTKMGNDIDNQSFFSCFFTDEWGINAYENPKKPKSKENRIHRNKFLGHIRQTVCNSNFLDHINDTSPLNRQVKKDFFTNYFHNGYNGLGFFQSKDTKEIGEYGDPITEEQKSISIRPDLTQLNDKYYANLKKELINHCLYSQIYKEKNIQMAKNPYYIKDPSTSIYWTKGTNEKIEKYLNAEHIYRIVSKLDKKIYGDFIKENKEAILENYRLTLEMPKDLVAKEFAKVPDYYRYVFKEFKVDNKKVEKEIAVIKAL